MTKVITILIQAKPPMPPKVNSIKSREREREERVGARGGIYSKFKFNIAALGMPLAILLFGIFKFPLPFSNF